MGDLTPNPEEFSIAAFGKDYCIWERKMGKWFVQNDLHKFKEN
jgi:hypothetical protein